MCFVSEVDASMSVARMWIAPPRPFRRVHPFLFLDLLFIPSGSWRAEVGPCISQLVALLFVYVFLSLRISFLCTLFSTRCCSGYSFDFVYRLRLTLTFHAEPYALELLWYDLALKRVRLVVRLRLIESPASQ